MTPQVQAYLQRIGYNGPVDGSAQALAQIQEAHLHAVPYENLDILQGVPLSLEVPDLYQKIVLNLRGGYCFELNALFRWLLEELGYPVTSLMSRFWRDESNPPPKRRHHVLKVYAEGEFYLCDVGVGGIVPRRPVKMVEGLEQPQGEETYRLDRDPEFGWMLWELTTRGWSRLYSFTEEPQLAKDFLMATYWCENSPESIFRKGAMVAIRTPQGRNSVAGKEFRLFTPAGVQAFTPQTEAEYREALLKHFGIRL